MTEQGKHTPIPWRAEKCAVGPPKTDGWPILRTGEWWIMSAPCPGEKYASDEEEAAHIVRCVNAHEALVEACRYTLRWLDESGLVDEAHPSIPGKLRAALAQAEVEL